MPGDDGYMTREEALKMLRAGKVEEWNAHRRAHRVRHPHLSTKDHRADLQGARLKGANLQLALLEGANLQFALLEGADLRGARMERADLRGAHLEGANLRGARLKSANLWDARLEGARLMGARLKGARLWYARLKGARLKGAHLEGADLMGARMEGADLRDARLEGADLRGARLEGADLRGTDLSKAALHHVAYDRKALRGMCKGLRGVDTCWGNSLLRRDLQDQDFLDTLEEMWFAPARRRQKGSRLEPLSLGDTRATKRDEQSTHRLAGLVPRPLNSARMERWLGRVVGPISNWTNATLRAPKWGLLFVPWGWLDYGRSLLRVAAIGLGIMLLFALIYQGLGSRGFHFDAQARQAGSEISIDGVPYVPRESTTPGESKPDDVKPADSFVSYLYLSVISFTSLGFGDVKPAATWARFWVMVEVILGYITLGLLLAVLAQKVARRS